MTNDPERDRLDDLAERIRQAEKRAEPTPAKSETDVEADRATVKASRMGFDFAAAVLICAALGWLIDRILGTGPWGIILMLFAGFAVGMMNVWRAMSGYEQTVGWRKKR